MLKHDKDPLKLKKDATEALYQSQCNNESSCVKSITVNLTVCCLYVVLGPSVNSGRTETHYENPL